MKTNLLTTILLSGAILASCNETNKEVDDKQDLQELASADTAVMYGDLQSKTYTADGVEINRVDNTFWNNVDFNAPVREDARLKNSGVEKREGQGYSAYTMDDRILFDLDKATLRSGADDKLKSISESIQEEHPQGEIRIYGYTDSIASKSYNKQLAEDRANAVKEWFQNNTEMDASRFSIQAVGEANPRATNETAEGRQKNRRVAIVVTTGQQATNQQRQ